MSLRAGHIGGFSDEELVAGDEESRRLARQEHRRRQRRHLAESSKWPRLDLADLRFGRHWVVHTPTGERYRIVGGEVLEAVHTPATAWYIASDGDAGFLEPVP